MRNFQSLFVDSIAYLLAVIPFVVIPLWWYPFVTGRIFFWCIAVGVALIFLWQNRKQQTSLRNPHLLIFCLFILWLFVRSIGAASHAWWGSWLDSDGLFFLFSAALLMMVFAHMVSWHRERAAGLYIVALCIGLIASRIIVLAPGAESLLTDSRWSGSVGNPLFFGTLLLFLPVMGNYSLQHAPRRIRFFAIFCLSLFALLLLYKTGSRGTMLAALVGLCVYAVLWMRTKLYPWWRIGIALAMFVMIGLGITQIGGRALSFQELNSTARVRVALYVNAVKRVSEHPFVGYGVSALQETIAKDSGALDSITRSEQIFHSTHSYFLDLLLAGGVIAFGLYLWWVWAVLRTLDIAARATFCAYHVALLTAPFQMWAFPAVLLLIACGQNKQITWSISARVARLIHFLSYGLYGVVAVSVLVLVLTLPVQAKKLQTAIRESSSFSVFVSYANESSFLFPYLTEQDALFAQQLIIQLQPPTVSGLSLSTLRDAFVPRVLAYITDNATPVDQLHTFALFVENYAQHFNDGAAQSLRDTAEAGYRAVLVRTPGRPATAVALAGLLESEGREAEVGTVLSVFLKQYPNSPTANFYWAVHLETTGDHAQAITYAHRALELRSRDQWLPDQRAWLDSLR